MYVFLSMGFLVVVFGIFKRILKHAYFISPPKIKTNKLIGPFFLMIGYIHMYVLHEKILSKNVIQQNKNNIISLHIF